MEFSLQNCEEVWLSKVFELKSITRKRINVSFSTTMRHWTLKIASLTQKLLLWALASGYLFRSFSSVNEMLKKYRCSTCLVPSRFLTALQIHIQGDSESNGRVELVKTTRDSQVIGSFSESRSRAFSIASKDSKLTDQNSYRVSYHLKSSWFQSFLSEGSVFQNLMFPS